MRILFFSREYTPHDHRYLASLAETEHEVFFLQLEKRGHAQESRPLPRGVRSVPWAGGKMEYSPKLFRPLLNSLRKVLKEVQPDIVHAGPVQTSAYLAARAGFKPLITMSWGSDMLVDAEKDAKLRDATQFTLDNSAAFICDNQVVVEKALQFGVSQDRIFSFPWGIDLEHFLPPVKPSELRARAGWEENIVLMHTRTWAPIYGVDVAARGFALAARQRPDLRLFLMGNGPLAANIRQIFLANGVLDRVQFPGQVQQEGLPAYYQAADLYLSASHSDGTSISLLEALATGLPAIVSDIPGNQEWVTPDVGWQFPDGDASALAERILEAAENTEERRKKGKAARQLAESRADWNKNFQFVLDAYQMAVPA